MSRSSAEDAGTTARGTGSGDGEGPGLDGMGRSRARRAQVEPLAALAAVLAVTVGLALYAGALDEAVPRDREPRRSPSAVDAVRDAASDPTGVVHPDRLSRALDGAAPPGRRANATLVAAGHRWTAGPAVPPGATDRATRRVGVRTADGVALGSLRVVVW